MSGNFGYVRKSSPLRDLDQIHHVNKYGRRSHVCKAWWLSVKECEFGNLPSPIDFRYRSYNIGHITVWLRDFDDRSFRGFKKTVLHMYEERKILQSWRPPVTASL